MNNSVTKDLTIEHERTKELTVEIEQTKELPVQNERKIFDILSIMTFVFFSKGAHDLHSFLTDLDQGPLANSLELAKSPACIHESLLAPIAFRGYNIWIFFKF